MLQEALASDSGHGAVPPTDPVLLWPEGQELDKAAIRAMFEGRHPEEVIPVLGFEPQAVLDRAADGWIESLREKDGTRLFFLDFPGTPVMPNPLNDPDARGGIEELLNGDYIAQGTYYGLGMGNAPLPFLPPAGRVLTPMIRTTQTLPEAWDTPEDDGLPSVQEYIGWVLAAHVLDGLETVEGLCRIVNHDTAPGFANTFLERAGSDVRFPITAD